MIEQNLVYVHKTDVFSYPEAPFDPGKVYPEFESGDIINSQSRENGVYENVRATLIGLKLDHKNIGTKKWNPFSEFIKKGDKIVIKPNLVRHEHPQGDIGVLSMITHASIIRPIIDYVLLATQKDCKITICDVPLQKAIWSQIISKSGLKDLVEYYERKGIKIDLLDLRREISHVNEYGVIVKRKIRDRDPLGYVSVDLKEKSELMPIIKYYTKLEITDYGSGTVSQHHNPDRNEYCITKTILDADVFINVPKLKTHHKAGISVAMKNMIGINGDKSWIAHHRRGSPGTGGDEYPKFHLKTGLKMRLREFMERVPSGERVLTAYYKLRRIADPDSANRAKPYVLTHFTEGSWHGNDTLWRCIKDLNKIILYSDKNGSMQNEIQRKYFCIVDGILAGEKEGPMNHTPKKAGVIIGGFNPVAIDYTAAEIMGFDWRKIPSVREGFKNQFWDLVDFGFNDIKIIYNTENKVDLKFSASQGWKDHIEK